MQHVRITWTDGQYGIGPLTPEEAAAAKERGERVACIRSEVYRRWIEHCEQCLVWDNLWRLYDEKYDEPGGA
jgi:hypothetical protein